MPMAGVAGSPRRVGVLVRVSRAAMVARVVVPRCGGARDGRSRAGNVRVQDLHTPLMRPWTTLYLGVNQPGALPAVGDGHAQLGDGATSGVAVETGMDVVLVVDVIAGVSTPVPRMETDTHLLSVGIAAQMHQAYRDSLADLTALVIGVTGLDPFDASQLVSQTVQVSLGNTTDPAFTMVAGTGKRHLGHGSCYHGGVAAEHLSVGGHGHPNRRVSGAKLRYRRSPVAVPSTDTAGPASRYGLPAPAGVAREECAALSG